MRTLQQMVERVKVHVRGAENLTWHTADYENVLEEAARLMWRHLSLGAGSKTLRYMSQRAPVPSDGIVAVPSDCLTLESVDVWQPGHAAPMRLKYMKPTGEDGCWAMECLHSVEDLGWTDDLPERQIRLVGCKPDWIYALRYLRMPVFPFEESGTLRDPSGEGVDEYPSLPDLSDAALEHLAAALLCGEELRDNLPIGYHGQQYSSYLSIMSDSVVSRQPRRYVRKVSGR